MIIWIRNIFIGFFLLLIFTNSIRAQSTLRSNEETVEFLKKELVGKEVYVDKFSGSEKGSQILRVDFYSRVISVYAAVANTEKNKPQILNVFKIDMSQMETIKIQNSNQVVELRSRDNKQLIKTVTQTSSYLVKSIFIINVNAEIVKELEKLRRLCVTAPLVDAKLYGK